MDINNRKNPHGENDAEDIDDHLPARADVVDEIDMDIDADDVDDTDDNTDDDDYPHREGDIINFSANRTATFKRNALIEYDETSTELACGVLDHIYDFGERGGYTVKDVNHVVVHKEDHVFVQQITTHEDREKFNYARWLYPDAYYVVSFVPGRVLFICLRNDIPTYLLPSPFRLAEVPLYDDTNDKKIIMTPFTRLINWHVCVQHLEQNQEPQVSHVFFKYLHLRFLVLVIL